MPARRAVSTSIAESPRNAICSARSPISPAIHSALRGSGLRGISARCPTTTRNSTSGKSAPTIFRVGASGLLLSTAIVSPSALTSRSISGTPG